MWKPGSQTSVSSLRMGESVLGEYATLSESRSPVLMEWQISVGEEQCLSRRAKSSSSMCMFLR